MFVKRKKFIVGMVCLGFFLVGGGILYLLLLPVPLSVINQIEWDLSERVPMIEAVYGPIGGSSLWERVFPKNLEPYTYEIVLVNEEVPPPQKESETYCVAALVTYGTGPDVFSLHRRTNPEYYNYLAEKVDGEWSLRFLDNWAATCK